MADNVVPFEPASALQGATITEDWAARQFANECRATWRYCHDHEAWFHFDGSTWRKDRVQSAYNAIRELVVRMSLPAKNKVSMQKAAFLSATERIAKSDPVFSMTAEDWDRDIFLLGTPDGTVDLRTGGCRPSKPSDYITKSTSVTPDHLNELKLWKTFLREATNGDDDLIRFLQQICGYALTGDITEQVLFFIYGEGGNGKGTFLRALQGIMKDYSTIAPMTALEKHKLPQHSTDMAMMRGARLVSANETDEGSAWDEQRVKVLTGGDQITAHFMHKDNFTYIPQFTLVVIGNFQPTLRSIDRAIQRRFNMIPFTVTPTSVDPDLDEKLRAEWPGILLWMIAGALDWREHGFVRPASVIAETKRYFEDQDTIGQWLQACCDVERDNEYKWELSSVLFKSWAAFARDNGIEAGSNKTFSPALIRRGFRRKHSPQGNKFFGVQLRTSDLI